jgi:hypothetical protein
MPTPARAATVDVVVPVHDEEATLTANVELLVRYLATELPLAWRVVIVDNASSDRTPAIAAAASSRSRATYVAVQACALALDAALVRLLGDAGAQPLVAYARALPAVTACAFLASRALVFPHALGARIG